MLIKLSTKCNRAVITLQKKKLFLLIKIGFRKVTQIDPQTLLKINPQTLLKLIHKRYSNLSTNII